jgi:hypothetical protein
MKMTMKVQFDPLNIAGSELAKAIKAVDKDAEITFHNSRETTPKKAAKPEAVKS